MVELKAKSSGNWKVDICPKYRKMQAYFAHFIVCCVWELAHSAVVCTEKNVVGMSSRKERQLRQHHGSCMYTVLCCTTALWFVLTISCLVGVGQVPSEEFKGVILYLSCSPQKVGIFSLIPYLTKIGVYLLYKKCQNAALCTPLCAAAVCMAKRGK